MSSFKYRLFFFRLKGIPLPNSVSYFIFELLAYQFYFLHYYSPSVLQTFFFVFAFLLFFYILQIFHSAINCGGNFVIVKKKLCFCQSGVFFFTLALPTHNIFEKHMAALTPPPLLKLSYHFCPQWFYKKRLHLSLADCFFFFFLFFNTK